MLPFPLVPERMSSFLLGACCWACAGLVPLGLTAQDARSLLTLLPTEGRTLSVGQEVQGELRAGDYINSNGNHVQAWEIRGDAGRSVIVDLVSDPLDSYLIVVGPGLGGGLTDDDGGEGLNSWLCVAFPRSGSYRIVASALGGRTGPYTVRVRAAREDEACDEEGGLRTGPEVALEDLSLTGTLTLGRAVEGRLARQDPVHRGGFVQAWALQGRAGQTVAIDLTSEDLDPYLFFLGPGLETMTDDDGGSGLDSHLCVTLPETGTYRVVASTFGDANTGPYRLVASVIGDGSCPDGMDMGMDMGFGEVTAANLEALPVVGTLTPGYGHDGTLTSDDPILEDGYAHAWDLHGTAGQTVTVELISDDFDCYLYLTGPGLDVLSDDDGAGSLDSRIEVTFPETATYRVVATTFGDFGTGAYQIRTFRTR